MDTITRTAAGLAIGLALAAPAAATVQGSCTYDGHRLALEDGAAWIVPPDEDFEPADWDGDGEPDPVPVPLAIGLGSFAFDHGALARATDRDDALSDQAFDDDGDDSGKLVLTIEDGEVTQLAAWFSPGTSISRGGDGLGTVEPAPSATGTGPVAGRYRYTDEDDGFACDVTFDVPRLGDPKDAPPPPGTPLPPGGGAPGQAYLALNQALRAGDLDALADLLPPDRAAEMRGGARHAGLRRAAGDDEGDGADGRRRHRRPAGRKHRVARIHRGRVRLTPRGHGETRVPGRPVGDAGGGDAGCGVSLRHEAERRSLDADHADKSSSRSNAGFIRVDPRDPRRDLVACPRFPAPPQSSSVNNDAFPPAAVVFTVIVRSVANRSR